MKFSTRRLFAAKKSGFTIREILIIIVIVSIGLMSTVVVLTSGMKYVQKTRQKVVALNLAREGMEAIYQMRDTNWTRRAGVKDICWLKTNPLVNEEVDIRCADDPRMMSGAYVLQRLTLQGQEYFALTGIFDSLNLADGVDTGDKQFSLCQQDGFWRDCMGELPDTSEGKYFRQIEGRGLFFKDAATTGGLEAVCSSGMNISCASNRAKEFRFCSKVAYIGESAGEVELCGVLTNFK